MNTLPGTPAADGFAMPAERDRHDGCWLAWPENGYAWRLGARPAQRAVATLANAIADTGEAVTVTVSDAQYANARSTLDGRLRVVETASWLAWARDVAPTFVLDAHGRRRGVDFGFDGYRRRYPYWQVDDRYAGKVLDLTRTDRYRVPLITEGGAFHVDGDGTGLVTAEAMIDRNPRLSRAEIDAALGEYLGVRTVLWLEHGLVDDPTAHIDNVAAFVEPGVLVLAWTDDPADPQHARCAQAFEALTGATDACGRRLRVEKLPLPRPRHPSDEELDGLDRTPAGQLPPTRIPASYCNYYLANGHVLMPLLDPETDAEAAAILGRLFPDRTVVPLDTRELLLGGGNIHCATQQIPSIA
ncbi:agmatine deiminase family protein [Labedaea rhizosphaerae]|uniref:Agmatine deiminase n=1 Tax=Labedaea rhizosphaerae TaxID=598644 RepID=A0A4R6SB19_LABRH|nr:agmatine deiminase family protein [Labedaea rhizosphaerae]TDP96733.1 agmatine deiminase [Labedaea rhizosphaerae]